MGDYLEMDPHLIRRARYGLLRELSYLEEELDVRRSQDRHLMRVSEREWSEEGFAVKLSGPAGRGANLVGPEMGFNAHNLTATLLEVPPAAKRARITATAKPSNTISRVRGLRSWETRSSQSRRETPLLSRQRMARDAK